MPSQWSTCGIQVKHVKKIKVLEESSQFNDKRFHTAEANIEKAKVVSKEYTDAIKKDLFYLKTYSRRENLNFVGIPEQLGSRRQRTCNRRRYMESAARFSSGAIGDHKP